MVGQIYRPKELGRVCSPDVEDSVKTVALRLSVLTAVLCLAITACSSGGQKSSSEGSALATTSPGATSSTWVKWDASKCALVPAAALSGQWQAVMRHKEGVRIGYGTQSEGVAVVDVANKSMKDAVGQAGGTYIFANYAYPDPAQVLTGARSITTRKAQVVASWNLVAPSMQSMLAIYKKACVPVIQMSAAAPGTVLFGPDNVQVGQEEGTGLLAWAKSKGWSASDSTVLGVTVPTLGASANQRVSSCIGTISKQLSGIGSSSLQLSESTTAAGQTQMNDWLTANPNKKHVLVCTPADTAAFGIANAAKSASRVDQVGVGGVGGSANPGGSFVGSVDFGFKNYGSIVVPLALDLVDGKPVPSTVSPPLSFKTGQ